MRGVRDSDGNGRRHRRRETERRQSGVGGTRLPSARAAAGGMNGREACPPTLPGSPWIPRGWLWRTCPLLEAPQIQPLCWWHLNLPFQPLPRDFLVPGQFSRKTLSDGCGTQPFPQPSLTPPLTHPPPPSPGLSHPIPRWFLSLPGPYTLPLSQSTLAGKTGGWGHRPD